MKMSKRTIKKQFWLSRSEAQDLQKKAKKACLSEAGLIRLLLKGIEHMVHLNDNAIAYMNKRGFRNIILSIETITS